jgi:tetratricopeptide (TPR) repeat protein
MDIEQLKKWHDSDDNEKIIDAVERLPLEERNFEIIGLYARALINHQDGRFQEALNLLMSFEEQGKEDGVWNFRVGCCFYYLRRKPEAAKYFQLAIDYGDEWEETKEMLEDSLKADDSWEYLFEYINKYEEILNKYPNGKMTDYFNAAQITLLAYHLLYGQVTSGGFIQFYHNGYGGFVFDSPFSKILKTWGAEKISEIVEKANVIYDKYKNELVEKKASRAEFLELYEKITDFEPLVDEFNDIKDEETKIIRKYVEENVNDFEIIV